MLYRLSLREDNWMRCDICEVCRVDRGGLHRAGDITAEAACWYFIEEGELYRLVYHSTIYEPRSMYAILHLAQRCSNSSVFCFDFDDCK